MLLRFDRNREILISKEFSDGVINYTFIFQKPEVTICKMLILRCPSGLDYTLEEAEEACKSDKNCVGISCKKRDNTCMLNNSRKSKNRKGYTGYVMENCEEGIGTQVM